MKQTSSHQNVAFSHWSEKLSPLHSATITHSLYNDTDNEVKQLLKPIQPIKKIHNLNIHFVCQPHWWCNG